MLKSKLFLFGAFILFTGIVIYSCTKDAVKNENQEQISSEADLQTLKSILKITDDQVTSVRTIETCGTPNVSPWIKVENETVLIPTLGCYAKVSYDINRYVNFGTGTEITDVFRNFKAVPIESMGCTALLDAWTVLYNNGSYDALATELDHFNSLASEEVEKAWVNNFFSQTFMQTYFQCGNNNKYKIEFFMDNCFKWCISYSTASGKPEWDFVRTSCGDNCCKRTRPYCWGQTSATNPPGPIVPLLSESIIQVGVCVQAQEANCGVGYVKSESCFHECFPH